jgi:hypothetical protein
MLYLQSLLNCPFTDNCNSCAIIVNFCASVEYRLFFRLQVSNSSIYNYCNYEEQQLSRKFAVVLTVFLRLQLLYLQSVSQSAYTVVVDSPLPVFYRHFSFTTIVSPIPYSCRPSLAQYISLKISLQLLYLQ